MSTTLTHRRLLEVLSYDVESGLFTWKLSTSRRIKIGSIAGSVAESGYRSIRIDGRLYYCQRLVWFYVFGEWPIEVIDHEHGDPDNNRLGNLRDVSQSLNMQNMRNARGVRETPAGTFQASVYVAKQQVHLGTFELEQDARNAYLDAKQAHHPGYSLNQ